MLENLPIVVLSILTVTLSILLILRTRSTNKLLRPFRAMDSSDYSSFLHFNSSDGNIQRVAGQVSDMLTSRFACEKILFLRKKKGTLELNYFHGITRFDRRDWRIRFHRELADAVRADFFPRRVDVLKSVLPAPFMDTLKKHELDTFFPVFWRENLYGIYFVRSNTEIDSSAFNVFVATLAQSLSAAYHIKWHETRLEDLSRKYNSANERLKVEDGLQGKLFSNFRQLIQQRKPESLLAAIVETLREDSGMEHVAILYQRDNDSSTQLVVRGRDNRTLKISCPRPFSAVVDAVGANPMVKIRKLAGRDSLVDGWVRELTDLGLEYLVPIPLTDDRSCILAFNGDPDTIDRGHMNFLRAHAPELMANVERIELIEELSYTDSLTGLANQRYFNKRLEEEIRRCRRYNRRLALIFFDLDDLKKVNDSYGHLAGDEILRQMGQVLRRITRSIDVVARYGGDEFCIIMPEADKETCVRFMRRLKEEVAATRFCADSLEKHLACTISLGGAVYPDHAEEARSLIHAADMALLRAKEEGRDRFLLSETVSGTA